MSRNRTLSVLSLAATFGLSSAALFYFASREIGTHADAAVGRPIPLNFKDIAGVYLQRSDEPMQARFRLEIHPDGKWAMANMLSGWWGTWRHIADFYAFRTTDSPSGKVEKPTSQAVEFDDKDTITLGTGPNQWIFDRLPAETPYEIPFDGRQSANPSSGGLPVGDLKESGPYPLTSGLPSGITTSCRSCDVQGARKGRKGLTEPCSLTVV